MEIQQFEKQYMAGLNPQQRTAVQAVQGPVLLLAVPGSGKTTVLVTRLGYMVLCCGIAPAQILTMTYTKAATHEMRSRFAARFGEQLAAQMAFRTINGLSDSIINYYSRRYNRRRPELLTDDGEISRLLTDLYRQLNEEYPTESTLKELRTAITYIKNMQLSEEELAAMETDIPHLPELFHRYQAALKRAGRMDFDDQTIYALQILRGAPAVLAYFQAYYRYICVDESQDTSKIQHQLIRLLANGSRNLFMVGDEDQSIYGFRAAYPQALMDFEKSFPGAQVLLMEENYRSGEEIIAAANSFVARSRYRRPKVIRATQGPQEPVEIRPILRREEQFSYLFALAQHCTQETAVLFRNSESALPLIDLCERKGIPYTFKKDDMVFFTHRIVLDVMDFIRFAYAPADGEIFMRLYYKLGLPLSKQQALAACVQSARSGRAILEELVRSAEVRPRVRSGLADVWQALKRIPLVTGCEAIDIIRNEAGYGAYLEQKRIDTGKLDILRLLGEQEPSAARLSTRLGELRNQLAVRKQSEVPFILSTIHSSKGLEYDHVILLDVFDGILPAQPEICCREAEDIRAYEEDRRLFYVAMTRARRKLTLFDCRMLPSAFVQEVAFQLPEAVAERERLKAAAQPPQTTKKAPPPIPLESVTKVGTVVQHAVFGRGIVQEFDGQFITIEFAAARCRKLDARLVAEKHLLWPAE